jgi:hypothetical protein
VVVKALKTPRPPLVMVVQVVVVRLEEVVLVILHNHHNLVLQVMETMAVLRLEAHTVLAVVAVRVRQVNLVL